MADSQKPLVLRGSPATLKGIVSQVLAIRQMLLGKDMGNLYTTPVVSFQNQFEFHPQVTLVFKQTKAEAEATASSQTDPEDRKEPVEGQISFRLMDETHTTMTPEKALVLAQKIKAKFAIPVYQWNKGIINYTYFDEKKGYKFRIAADVESVARNLIEFTLDIRGNTPDWDLLREHIPKKLYPVKPNKELIYGKQKRPPRRRPVEIVKFKYAEMHVWGIPTAVTLVDITGNRPNPLVIN